MRDFINCMTHALDLENKGIPSSEFRLWYSFDPFAEISVKCKKSFHRTCRKVKRNDKLHEGEWLVAFFGFVALKFDYEGRPEIFDYHFVRQEIGGIWTERPSIFQEVRTTDIDCMISEYAKVGIKPMFLAIGKEVEE